MTFTLFNLEGTRVDGGIAQLGEHLLCKQGVIGSSPIISTKKWTETGPELRWLERTTENREVGGSSPPGPTTYFFLKEKVSKKNFNRAWFDVGSKHLETDVSI